METAAPLETAAPTNFGILHMFLQADIVVQAVIVGLLLASVVTWAIFIEKSLAISRERKATTRFETLFWSGKSLEEIEYLTRSWKSTAIRDLFSAALREWRLSSEGGAPINLMSFRERVQATMEVEGQKHISRLESRLLFLATVGAAGPFIGLFGTVWGIMNSFSAIASAKDTSLAVVAPGIAEALFATALGLVAAIPAVIFYNKFSNDIANLGSRLESFSREFWTTISREIDLQRARQKPAHDRELVGHAAR